jgi:hypothetical protein
LSGGPNFGIGLKILFLLKNLYPPYRVSLRKKMENTTPSTTRGVSKKSAFFIKTTPLSKKRKKTVKRWGVIRRNKGMMVFIFRASTTCLLPFTLRWQTTIHKTTSKILCRKARVNVKNDSRQIQVIEKIQVMRNNSTAEYGTTCTE